MTTKADYAEEEWQVLMQAPVMAGSLVMMADLHVTSMMGEMKGMVEAMVQDEPPQAAKELVGSLVEDIKARTEKKEKLEPPETKGKDPAAIKAEMMQVLTNAVAILDEKSSQEETEGYKQWMMVVAQATAEAGREGGFLGFGSVRVSDKEKEALTEISQVLGLG